MLRTIRNRAGVRWTLTWDGAFNFVHSSTINGSERSEEFFAIVPTSGTGDLAGIRGSGGLAIDADGTHRAWIDYELD